MCVCVCVSSAHENLSLIRFVTTLARLDHCDFDLASHSRWGTKRLAAAVVVREILSEVSPGRWFIESGTLLGALRNGRFIPHDDDFDIALVVEGEDAVAELHALRATLAERLPPSLEARVVSSYCDKIEV